MLLERFSSSATGRMGRLMLSWTIWIRGCVRHVFQIYHRDCAVLEIFEDDSGFVAWDQEILVAMKQYKIQADETMVQGLTPAHTAREINVEMEIDNKALIQAA
jgi:hypothetical protein